MQIFPLQIAGAGIDVHRAIALSIGKRQLVIADIDLAAARHAGHPVGIAQKAHDEGAVRLAADLLRRALLYDLALIENDDTVSKIERLFLVMRHENRGDAERIVNLAQPAAQVAAHIGVQRPKGLIEQKHLRID